MPKLVRRAPEVDGAGGEEFLREAKQVDRHPKPALFTYQLGGGSMVSHLEVWEKEPGEGCDTD